VDSRDLLTETQIRQIGSNYLYYRKTFPGSECERRSRKLLVRARHAGNLEIDLLIKRVTDIARTQLDTDRIGELEHWEWLIETYLRGYDPTPPKDGEEYIAVAEVADGQWRCRRRYAVHQVEHNWFEPRKDDDNTSDSTTIEAKDIKSLVKTLHQMGKIAPTYQWIDSKFEKVG